MKPETIKAVCQAHCDVVEEIGVEVSPETTIEIFGYCIRKLKYIGKDEDYLPILYRCELPLQLSMRAINRMSEAIRKERKGGEMNVQVMHELSLRQQMS